MFSGLRNTYKEFPSRFWTVVGVMFVDRVGGTMLFPFFMLYITQRFDVGVTQAGTVMGFFSLFGMLGGVIGGALTDKFGRRSLIIFGLVFSALSTLSLGLVKQFWMLFPLAVLTGLLSDVAGPANQAMIADILPENFVHLACRKVEQSCSILVRSYKISRIGVRFRFWRR